MKKMLLALALFITVGTTSVFAREENVSKKVLRSFETEFSTAQEVTWSVGTTFYKAAFTLNGQKVFAYYSIEGDLMGVARYISSVQLPLHLLTDLRKQYADFWISDLFEVNNSEGTHYYVTLENADSVLKLSSEASGYWESVDKQRKI